MEGKQTYHSTQYRLLKTCDKLSLVILVLLLSITTPPPPPKKKKRKEEKNRAINTNQNFIWNFIWEIYKIPNKIPKVVEKIRVICKNEQNIQSTALAMIFDRRNKILFRFHHFRL